MKKFLKKYYVLLIILIVCILTMSIGIYLYFYNLYKIDKDFSKIDLTDIDNLMIVAHPDDETLWGGAHLIEDDYLVVCITCGPNKTRVNEFVKVMHETNDKYIMLGYPDKTNGERDNWDSVRDDITKDLESIVALKDWHTIITHNPDGEYGHIHHKMTSSLTTNVVSDKSKLFYFGHYYSKKNLVNNINDMLTIDDNLLSEKKNIIGLYKSQSFIQTSFDQMIPYENWVNYNDWGKSTYRNPLDFSKINLKNVNKLMIVAHPDDDTIWGGAHLIEDDYLVVCVTCGVDKVLVKEFEKVMKETKDKYIMLGYPDKTNGERDNWDSVRGNITQDIKDIITLKDWDLIVTHNPDGEYGHIHHQMTSSITTYVVPDKSKLYYFGRYYKKDDLNNHLSELTSIKKKELKEKNRLLKLYESQYFINEKFGHMYPYENWVKASEWSEA